MITHSELVAKYTNIERVQTFVTKGNVNLCNSILNTDFDISYRAEYHFLLIIALDCGDSGAHSVSLNLEKCQLF